MAHISQRSSEVRVSFDRKDYLVRELSGDSAHELGMKAIQGQVSVCANAEKCGLTVNQFPSPWGDLNISCGSLVCPDPELVTTAAVQLIDSTQV